jgi:hypothetical protein
MRAAVRGGDPDLPAVGGWKIERSGEGRDLFGYQVGPVRRSHLPDGHSPSPSSGPHVAQAMDSQGTSLDRRPLRC